MSGDISRNLSRREFACHCGCGFDTVDFELAKVLQDVVDHFQEGTLTKIRIHINSGCRCKKHNANEGGSLKSKHLIGRAADFYLEHIHPDKVADYLESKYHDKYGIGRYIGRTHFDSRRAMARWDNR
jgi:uncharacterized protein YcbK (DUF882 family)